MSLYDWVSSTFDAVTDAGESAYETVAESVTGVKEYFVGDDEEVVADEVDGVVGTNGITQQLFTTSSGGFNWTAAGVIVGVAGIALKLVK